MISRLICFVLFTTSYSSLIVEYPKQYKTIEAANNATKEFVLRLHLDNETEVVPKHKKNQDFLSTLIEEDDPIFNFKSSDCRIEDWNTIRTDTIPNWDLHMLWADRNIGNQSYLYNEKPGLLAAFALKDQIIITTTAERMFNRTVYCRYYDCNKKEIPDQFQTVIYPESTVFCARRSGAEFISISETLEEVPEFPVPIVPRIGRPKHHFTVCMATLYGDEPKFLQIVDFIEYYRLQGATFFHIYLRNVSDYDRILLDDYVRTGDIEIIKMHDHYWRADFMWHHVQINDCHHRNKHFAKWTAVIDVDERIEMRSEEHKTITSLLDSVTDPNIVNLHFKVQWVIKDDNTPAEYISDNQLINEMIFHKYQNTSQLGNFWTQPKCIIRPEKIGMMTIHAPLALYSGVRRTLVNETIGITRHYRNVEQRVFNGALKRMMDHAPFDLLPIEKWIDDKLTAAILRRVKWVYGTEEVSCELQQQTYRKHGGIQAPCWLQRQALNATMGLPVDDDNVYDKIKSLLQS